jgi:dephospho-CoA kinase
MPEDAPSKAEHPGMSAAPDAPRLVGVTGPIGAGKSLLVRLLAERHGIPVLDADRLGHEVIGPAGVVRDAVLERFGEAIKGPDGEIDRARLGVLVFRDPSALAALEEISHPAILAAILQRVADLKGAGYEGMILLDAAVLPRWLGRIPLAALILVTAPMELRLARLVQRGSDPDEARQRIAAQESWFGPDIAADRSIDNSGTMESLEISVEALWRELADRFGRSRRNQSA